ncbi:MAG: flagellar filament capping protein FliD [Lautropia sp.]
MAVSGISGGAIDVNAIVTSLMEVESAPLTKFKTQISGIDTKISAWGKLQSAMSSLRDASKALVQTDTWKAVTAASADDTVIKATGGAGAAPGKYSITVQKLAQSQSVATAGFASGDTIVGGGMLNIRMGSVDAAGTTFTADAARPEVAINIPPNATLADIRAAINGAGTGVSASILDDGTGKRLVLTSRDSGRNQAFEIGVTDSDGNDADAQGLSALAMSATAASGANGTQRTQLASNAELTVNGLAVSAGSNRLDSVIEGLTLDVRKVSATPIEVAITTDQEALKTKVDAFVTEYNALAGLLNEQTKYDAGSKTAGTLQGNSIAVGIRAQMRQLLSATLPGTTGATAAASGAGAGSTGGGSIGTASVQETGGTLGTSYSSNGTGGSGSSGASLAVPRSLGEAGFDIKQDGTIALNEQKFAPLLADPERLRALLSGDATDAPGLLRTMEKRLGSFLDTDGALKTATDSLSTQKKVIEDKQSRFESRLTDIETRLRRQYSTLDKNLSEITNALAGINSLLP